VEDSEECVVYRICTGCGERKPITRFSKKKNGPGGIRTNCKECNNAEIKRYHANNPGYAKMANKRQWRRRKELEEFNTTLLIKRKIRGSNREGCIPCVTPISEIVPTYTIICQACEVDVGSTKICLDHNHATGKFRGWLCDDCNVSLGRMKDSAERLRRLADYIETCNEHS
jgi:hypothetical protein